MSSYRKLREQLREVDDAAARMELTVPQLTEIVEGLSTGTSLVELADRLGSTPDDLRDEISSLGTWLAQSNRLLSKVDINEVDFPGCLEQSRPAWRNIVAASFSDEELEAGPPLEPGGVYLPRRELLCRYVARRSRSVPARLERTHLTHLQFLTKLNLEANLVQLAAGAADGSGGVAASVWLDLFDRLETFRECQLDNLRRVVAAYQDEDWFRLGEQLEALRWVDPQTVAALVDVASVGQKPVESLTQKLFQAFKESIGDSVKTMLIGTGMGAQGQEAFWAQQNEQLPGSERKARALLRRWANQFPRLKIEQDMDMFLSHAQWAISNQRQPELLEAINSFYRGEPRWAANLTDRGPGVV